MTISDPGVTAAELALLEAATTGKFLDVRPGSLSLGIPASAEACDNDAKVRAELLAELLKGKQTPDSGQPRAIKLRGARITGLLDLEASKLRCPLLLQDCLFEEQINLNEAEAISIRLRDCRVPGLTANQLRTVGNVEFTESFTAHGEVSMIGAHISGTLSLIGATLINDNGPALNALGLTVDQNMICIGLTTHGEISLVGAHIGGIFNLIAAKLTNESGPAIIADGLEVGQSMICRGNLTVRGELRMVNAHIGGQLDFTAASLNNENGTALNVDNLAVDQDILCKGLIARGEVTIRAARIGGGLSLIQASLMSKAGTALDAYKLAVDQDMFCDRLNIDGLMTMVGAHVGGAFGLAGASITNENGTALNAFRMTIDQDMNCKDLAIRGSVAMFGAHIGGTFNLAGASITNENGTALNAIRMTIDQDMNCKDLRVRGSVAMLGAHIGGVLNLAEAILSGRAGEVVLDLMAAKIEMLAMPRERPQGEVRLTNATVGAFADFERGWPTVLHLRGFVYDRFGKQKIGTRARLQWLQRHSERFTPQLYDQLADAYMRAGDDGSARKVKVAKQWRRRRPYNPLNWLWYVTVGYGYRTWQALIWIAALVVVGSMVFSHAYPAHVVALTAHPPRFQPVVYALDVLLPVVGLGQKTAWQPNTSSLLDWYWALTAAGWVLGAAVIAGLTGFLKRD